MLQPRLLLLLILPLLGCPAPPEAEDARTFTDNSTWTIDVATEWPTGWQDVEILVSEPSGEARSGLTLEVEVGMATMGHGSDEPVTVTEPGDGLYVVRVHFQMDGAWELSGTLRDGELSDTFVVDLDVVAE